MHFNTNIFLTQFPAFEDKSYFCYNNITRATSSAMFRDVV
jgi:hypothetical protein